MSYKNEKEKINISKDAAILSISKTPIDFIIIRIIISINKTITDNIDNS